MGSGPRQDLLVHRARYFAPTRSLDAVAHSAITVKYFDTNLPGFCVRVTPNGVKTFSVLYRHAGRKRRYTIGTYPPLTLADARDKAKAALRSAEEGEDPAAEKRALSDADTFAELAELYMERHAKPKKKSWRDDDRRVNNVLVPRFGKIHAKSITRADVRLRLEVWLFRDRPRRLNESGR